MMISFKGKWPLPCMLLCVLVIACGDTSDSKGDARVDTGTVDTGPLASDYLQAPEHLWFKLNSTSGDQMIDSSDNQAHAQLTGTYTWDNGKIVFSVPDSGGETPDMPLSYRQTPHSVSAWVVPYARDDRSANNYAQTPFPVNCVSNDIPGHGGFGFGINVWTDGDSGSQMIVGGVGNVDGLTFTAGQRYHVVVVYSATETKVYLDNQVVYTGDAVTLSEGSAPVYIGRHNNDGNYGTKRFFIGEIDDVRVYQQALTTEDVSLLSANGPV
jgi:hypothetical protein